MDVELEGTFAEERQRFFLEVGSRVLPQTELDEYFEELSPLGYRAASMGELLYCVGENGFLYDTVPYFFAWANNELKPKKKKV